MNIYTIYNQPSTLPVFGSFVNYVVFIFSVWAVTYYFQRDKQYSLVLAYNLIIPVIVFLLQSLWFIMIFKSSTGLDNFDGSILKAGLANAFLYLFFWPQHVFGFLLGIFSLWIHKKSPDKKYTFQFYVTLLLGIFGLFWSYETTFFKF